MRIDFFRGTRIEMRYSNENRKRIYAEKKLKRKSIFDICIDIGKIVIASMRDGKMDRTKRYYQRAQKRELC